MILTLVILIVQISPFHLSYIVFNQFFPEHLNHMSLIVKTDHQTSPTISSTEVAKMRRLPVRSLTPLNFPSQNQR